MMRVVCVLGVAGGVASGQTLIDFDDLPAFDDDGTTPSAASVLSDDLAHLGVIFGSGTSAGVAVIDSGVIQAGSGMNSVVGLDAAGDIPSRAIGDIAFRFVDPFTGADTTASGVSFTIGDGGGDLDEYEISAYDLDGNRVYFLPTASTGRFAVNISSNEVARVEIDFTGAFGYSLDDLAYTVVPGPGSAGVAALGLVFAARRRRWG